MEKPTLHFEEETPIKELNEHEKIRLEIIAKILQLVEKINESNESITFPGITPEAYSRMKKDDEEFPGYSTPIDEIIERCENENIKIVLGTHPESGDFWVVPANSTDIEMDCIPPLRLRIDAVKNEHLRELIQLTIKIQTHKLGKHELE